jgi:hypothetical protein
MLGAPERRLGVILEKKAPPLPLPWPLSLLPHFMAERGPEASGLRKVSTEHKTCPTDEKWVVYQFKIFVAGGKLNDINCVCCCPWRNAKVET